MKWGIEITAPRTNYARHGCLVYDEAGDKLEGFVEYGQADKPELYRFYPRGTVHIIASLNVTSQEWRIAKSNQITQPGQTLPD